MTSLKKTDAFRYKYKTSIPIRFNDFDALGHANNAVYLTYFEIARSAYWKEIIEWDWSETGVIIASAEIQFLKPIVLNDEIFAYVRTTHLGTTSFTLEYALVRSVNGAEEICTTGSTVCVSFDYITNQKAPIPEGYRSRMLEFEALV
ncbi:MAG TPA: thioesterase family protein [Sphingobacteriaceae bacterium]